MQKKPSVHTGEQTLSIAKDRAWGYFGEKEAKWFEAGRDDWRCCNCVCRINLRVFFMRCTGRTCWCGRGCGSGCEVMIEFLDLWHWDVVHQMTVLFLKTDPHDRCHLQTASWETNNYHCYCYCACMWYVYVNGHTYEGQRMTLGVTLSFTVRSRITLRSPGF